MTNKHKNPGETCRRCCRDVVIGFSVDDDVWNDVHDDYDILCTICFDELAYEKRVPYSFNDVYPVSWWDWRVKRVKFTIIDVVSAWLFAIWWRIKLWVASVNGFSR